jgi:hypothetical protein
MRRRPTRHGPPGLVIVCVVDAVQTRDVLFGAGAVADAMRLGTRDVVPDHRPGDVESIALQLRPFGVHASMRRCPAGRPGHATAA